MRNFTLFRVPSISILSKASSLLDCCLSWQLPWLRVANWALVPWRALALGGCDPACLPFQPEELLQDSWGVNRKCYQVDLNPCYGLNTSSNEELTLAKQPSACTPWESLSLWKQGQFPGKGLVVLHPPMFSWHLLWTGAFSLLESQASQDGKLTLT